MGPAVTTFTPRDFQREFIDRSAARLINEQKCGCAAWHDPGLGKTAATLSLMQRLDAHLKMEEGRPLRTLVIAPLRVCSRTWPEQIKTWEFPFSHTVLCGTAKQRTERLNEPTAIHLTNPESLLTSKRRATGTNSPSGAPEYQYTTYEWLFAQKNLPGYDLLILDESQKFKNWSAVRTKSLRKNLARFRWVIGLTGTPADNSLADAFAQVYALDRGEGLGKTITFFRNNYMLRGGFQGKGWVFREDRKSQLYEAVSPVVHRCDAATHLDLPKKIDHIIKVALPERALTEYVRLERQLFIELEAKDAILTASSAGAMYSLCRQLANGGVYEKIEPGAAGRKVHQIHTAKVEALEDLIDELQGKPVLVAYQFQQDLERLQRAFPKAPIVKGGQSAKATTQVLDDWESGNVHVLLTQCQTVAEGIDGLQKGGNDIAWFGLTDQPGCHTQYNARVHRQGNNGKQVRIHYLLAENTVDEAIWDRLQDKDKTQDALLAALKRHQERQQRETY